jgi:N-acetylglucosamine malate deacetylase 1
MDILAFAAHPDDVELACGGTILKLVAQGYQVGVIDFSRGELGSRGTPEIRQQEADVATKLMGISVRENLGIPDGNMENNVQNRLKIITSIRRHKPSVILINAPEDRHPDHPNAAQLSLDAIFYAGLAKIESFETDGTPQTPHRPRYVLHYIQSDGLSPHIVVDVSDVWQERLALIYAFGSQFYNPNKTSTEPETFISSPQFLEWIIARAKTLGYRINAEYGEGFLVANLPLGTDNLMDLLQREKRY